MFHFQYHQPGSLEELIDLAARYGETAALLAGGTALLVDLKQGKLDPEHVLSLWGLPELRGIAWNGGPAPRIGAACTVTEIAEEFSGRPAFRGLAEAALLLGSRQLQNVATPGGNICKASPAADLVPPLLCLDARLVLEGPAGARELPLDGFLTGPGATSLRPAEVLTGIRLPAQPPRCGSAFVKKMRRQALDLSIAAACAQVAMAEDGQSILECRIGLGAVGPYPFRARKAEALLAGSRLEPELLRAAASRAREEARPISDVRASADYRSALVEVLVRRAVSAAAGLAMEGESGA